MTTHGVECDCGHDHGAPADAPGGWSAVLPLLACLLCPACLATWAKLGSSLGAGVMLSEAAHGWVLAAAVSFSLGVSAWRTRRTGRPWPLAVAVCGAALVAAGHGLLGSEPIEWAGIAVMAVGGLAEQLLLARRRAVRARAKDGALQP
ncbi:MAG: MerC domain-containing protein [Deltaproteobacteria bacterium]|nr:MerC domain-containing protein [Deltaproteobacteria bacterium]